VEVLMDEVEDRLLKRFTILKKLEYYITESVYYRSNSEDMNESSKLVVWKFGEENGKIHLL
jgi:hypothetical protein